MQAWNGDKNGALIALSAREGEETQRPQNGSSDSADWNNRTLLAKWVGQFSAEQSITVSARAEMKERQTDLLSFLGTGRFGRTTSLQGDDNSESRTLSLEHRAVQCVRAL